MKRLICLFFVLIISVSLLCANGTSSVRKIIIDTDTAGDDCMAIMMAAKSPSVNILGVTVVAGNVVLEQGMNNALMALEVAGCDAPVFPGAATSLDGIERPCFSVFGKDGMGDLDLIHPSKKPEKKSAVDFILETIQQYPNEIEIVCLGPVTNIANAFKKNPSAINQVKKIWVMGTAGFGQGNATPVAEYNTFKDAEALEILFQAKIPMTIIGLDVCKVCFSADQLKKMEKGSPVQAFAAKSNYGLLKFRKEVKNKNDIDLADQIAMSCFLWNDYVKDSVMCSAVCIADGSPAHGLAIFYKDGAFYDSMPENGKAVVEVITDVKYQETYKRIFNLLK